MAKHQNDAFMMKLGWGLVTRRDALWVRFMREKYKCGGDTLPVINTKRGGSQAWKGIKANWERTMDGMVWKVGNGETVRFWQDRWLFDYAPLKSYSSNVEFAESCQWSVADYVSDSGGWRWDLLAGCLPEYITKDMERIRVQRDGGMRDRFLWRFSSHGGFSVKSACESLKVHGPRGQAGLWRRIWKLRIPQRCKTFLWLAMKGRLLTNVARRVRRMTECEMCPLCGQERESTVHALCHCSVARERWKALLPPTLASGFFKYSTVVDWVRWNLSKEVEVDGVQWAVCFPIACRMIWLARNRYVFDQVQESPSTFKARSLACLSGLQVNLDGSGPGSERRIFEWLAPALGWVKVNVDGARSGGNGDAACGGVFRNHRGEFLQGFMVKLEPCGSTLAELWAVLWGLKLAWDAGFRRLELECDCSMVVDWILNDGPEEHAGEREVNEIRSMLGRDWQVSIVCCRREVNGVADRVAKQGLGMAQGLFRFMEPFSGLVEALQAESRGSNAVRWCEGHVT